MNEIQQQILDYIGAHPGCNASGVNKAVRQDRHFADWIYTRRDIDELIAVGLVWQERDADGNTRFYKAAES